jgi:transcriptional regulator with XRE-family HTH domain
MTDPEPNTTERAFEAQQMFGPRLKAERERKGITLKSIAESRKIKESLLAALERNDLSKWPQGIFRRAHFCDYVSEIGLPSAPLLAEFLLLFPDDAAIAPAAHVDKPRPDPVDRLRAIPAAARRRTTQLWSFAFDSAATLLLSSIAAALLETDLLPTIAGVFLAYAAIAAASFGETFGAHVARVIGRSEARPLQAVSSAARRELRVIVSARKRASGRQQTAA